MIAVFCPGCRRRVLLPASHITCLATSRNTTGETVHLLGFRCWCGRLGATVVPGPTRDLASSAAR